MKLLLAINWCNGGYREPEQSRIETQSTQIHAVEACHPHTSRERETAFPSRGLSFPNGALQPGASPGFARLFRWRPHGFGCRTFQRSSAFVPGGLSVYHVLAGFCRVRNSRSSRQLWYAYPLFHVERHARALLCNHAGRHDSRIPAYDLVVISPRAARPSFRCQVPRSIRSSRLILR